MIFRKCLFRSAAVAICLVLFTSLIPANAQQAVKLDPSVKALVDTSTKIGAANGSTYYFKDGGAAGINLIFAVSEDAGKLSIVCTIQNGLANFASDSEKRTFQGVQDNLTVKQLREMGLSGAAAAPQNANVPQLTGSVDGTVVKKEGGVIEVTLQGYVVDFHDNGDDIVITKVGGVKVGQLQYVAAMQGGAAQKAKSIGRVAGNLAVSGITLGGTKMTSVNPHSTAITTFLPGGQEYMVNSDNIEGKMSVPPFVGTAMAAVDLVRKQNSDFKIPNESNLRQLVARIPTIAAPPTN
jgi:hypothetical protein